ncbi:MAG: pyridoxamine 5'-phosphate oxidase family protein [bacterium]|nr:pyridoxamine 5'-phosphate oxidase family protein [bacterium]
MDPVAEIIAARQAARQQQDPYVDVCMIATVTAAGRPEVRAISLRDIDPEGFGLLLNMTSPKWQQLSIGGQCSLHLLWSTIRRQYRVYGRLEPMPSERLQRYWNRKGHASRLLEHYYETFHAQSQPIPSRAYLLEGMAELKRRYPDEDTIPVADTLRGVYLYPTEIDVWHGSPEDRLHDRRLFTRTENGWSFTTLVP